MKLHEILHNSDIETVLFYLSQIEDSWPNNKEGYEYVFCYLLENIPVESDMTIYFTSHAELIEDEKKSDIEYYKRGGNKPGPLADQLDIDVDEANRRLAEKIENDDYPEPNPYFYHVYGCNGDSMADLEEDNRPESMRSSYEAVTYALELTPWDEWLGMDVDEVALQEVDHGVLLANCLYEMTFVGFDEEKVKNEKKELDRLYDDAMKEGDEEDEGDD